MMKSLNVVVVELYLDWKHLNGRALRVADPPGSLCGLSAALDVP